MRQPMEEPAAGPGRGLIDADTAAELAGPANRMNEQDLIDATTTRARVGDADHDFRVTREGPEVCTACAPTTKRLTEMLQAKRDRLRTWDVDAVAVAHPQPQQ